jgi:hypothetical protein
LSSGNSASANGSGRRKRVIDQDHLFLGCKFGWGVFHKAAQWMGLISFTPCPSGRSPQEKN